MSTADNKKEQEQKLRALAESAIPFTAAPTARPVEELLHELQVHQIELEIQNEALRHAQSALEESRDRYVDLYEFAPVGYLTLTADGLIANINLTGIKLLRMERKELLQKRFTALVVAEDLDRWNQLFLNVKQLAGTGRVELALQRGDGTVLQVQMDCERQKVGDGDTAIRIALTDITERKQAETQMMRQAQRAEALLQLPRLADELDEQTFMQRSLTLTEDLTGSPVSFMHFVNDDEDTIELVAWSQRTIAHYCHAAFDRHYPVSSAGIWADAVRQRAPVICNDYANYPGKMGLPDGHAQLVRFVSVPVIEKGKVVMLTGVGNSASAYDEFDLESVRLISSDIWHIVQRRRDQQDLLQQKALLETRVAQRTVELTRALEVAKVADQTKDAFLANMSHELRTPLSAVIGIANLAQGISTEPRLRDYLEKIVRSGKHLNRIINELLDLSKIAAGRMELEIITFSLRTVIAHVESVMAHRAAEKGLAVVLVIDDTVPDVLLGDPTRLTQIFLNLTGNALKFTHAGQVAIHVGLRASEESRVCLAIDFEDTGIGMRPDDLKQLFQPFSQADSTVSRKFGGTGLGLTISRRLAEMMDGDISVTSIEGSGSTFRLRIWLGLGKAADLPVSEPAVDASLPKCYLDARILVADDQPLNREIVEALLAAVGITPRLTKNGQEALDILTASGPDAFDLVLMDIQMPIMDGLTATRALRSQTGFESLPIIAMTAHTLAHEQEINAAAGMNDHIGKPFDNASFYRTLAKWIPKAKQKTTGAPEASPAQPEALPDAGNELRRLRGVDVASALARFCGNEVSYRRWLTEFAATAGAVPGQMRSEIAAGQTDAAGKLAHAFKGRVGMLGMTELHGIASALELVLHDGMPTDELLATLERSIDEIRDELARVVNPGTAESATATQVLESVVWNDTYSVGVPALDEQHKKLVGMINRLADCHAARSCESSGAFHEVLSRMFDYTQIHFKDEEDYLHRIGYPQLADQKIEHAAFVGKMAAFSMAAADGVQDEAAVQRYLKAWLLSHILESDMQYRTFVESKL